MKLIKHVLLGPRSITSYSSRKMLINHDKQLLLDYPTHMRELLKDYPQNLRCDQVANDQIL